MLQNVKMLFAIKSVSNLQKDNAIKGRIIMIMIMIMIVIMIMIMTIIIIMIIIKIIVIIIKTVSSKNFTL